MYKIKLKKNVLAVLIILAGILLASAFIALQTAQFTVALPVLLIGAFSFFLVINLLMYTKATTAQILVLSTINISILCITYIASIAGMRALGFGEFALTDSLELTTSLGAISISTIASLFSIKSVISFELPIKPEENTIVSEKIEIETPPIVKKQVELPTFNQAIKPEPQNNPVQLGQQLQQKVEKNVIAEAEIEEIPKIEVKTLQPVQKDHNPIQELVPEQLERMNEFTGKSTKQVFEQEENMFEVLLTPLPNISFEEAPQMPTSEKTTQTPNNVPQDEDIFIYEDTDEFIPQNIRLVGGAKSKLDPNNRSTISSIGKLLVNFRDIENIIQINDIMQQIGCESEGKQIVSLNKGVKIYERFNKILVDYQGIKNLMLVDRAGFIIASIIEHEEKEQNLGAISSVAFLILQNYLNQLQINDLQKVLFISEDLTITLFKVEENIMSFSIDEGFQFINFNEAEEYLNKDTLEHYELPLIKNIRDIEEVVITDMDGKLVDAIYTGTSKKLASISSAIIENMKIFISNIHPSPLKRIVLIASEKTITINKYPDDKIVAYLSKTGYPVQLTECMSQIEEIISNKG